MNFFLSCILLGQIALISASCTKNSKKLDHETITSTISTDIQSLDPAQADSSESQIIVAQIYETLLHYHYLKRPLQIRPKLSSTMPIVSRDGLTHTFKIKKGVKFQDSDAFPGGKGRQITAHDFIYSWKRLSDPRSRNEGFWIFDGRISGLNEWRGKLNRGEGNFSDPVDGLQAPNNSTLVIKLTKPYFQLHYVLTMPFTSVVAKEVAEKFGENFGQHPVGTGPFQLSSWEKNKAISLVKNPNWLGAKYPSSGERTDRSNGLLKDAGKNLPLSNRIIFKLVAPGKPRWTQFSKGLIDTTATTEEIFATAIDGNKLKDSLAKKGIQVAIHTRPDLVFTAFNMTTPLIRDNQKLRQAIAHALDTKTFIERFYQGRAVRAQSLIPPDVDGYEEKFKNPSLEYNLTRAKELLAQAGFANGEGLPELEYSTTKSEASVQMAEYFKSSMEKIGVRVNIVTSSLPSFSEKIRDNKAQIWGMSWQADYPDAQHFLQLLYGGNLSPGLNSTGFKNTQFDRLYKKAALLPPGETRTQLYKRMRDIFSEQLPWIPQAHRLKYHLRHSWLLNYKPHSLILDRYQYLRVDEEKKSATQPTL